MMCQERSYAFLLMLVSLVAVGLLGLSALAEQRPCVRGCFVAISMCGIEEDGTPSDRGYEFSPCMAFDDREHEEVGAVLKDVDADPDKVPDAYMSVNWVEYRVEDCYCTWPQCTPPCRGAWLKTIEVVATGSENRGTQCVEKSM